jgi:NH3-dependent NAD+ synthetase
MSTLINKKFLSSVDRLVAKMKLSKTPVPGFIIGLSGTDSLLAFALVYEAAEKMGIAHRVLGVHYTSGHRTGWFEEHIVPWLREHAPLATIIVETPLGGNFDQQRWADLHMRALHTIEHRPDRGRTDTRALDPDKTYWVVGTINKTEWALGKYSALANTASIQPIRGFSKTEVIAACRLFKIPEIAIEYSRIPDCLCGRDELAAHNIELIDEILDFTFDATEYDHELLRKMFAYIADLRRTNDFKQRVPYTL